jgi:ribokinase
MEMLRNCDYLFLNLPEAYILTGCTDKTQAVEKLLCGGVPNVVITEGSIGAGFYSCTDKTFVEACKVEAVDTTGAGDSFTAGFIKGIYMNYGIAKFLKLGNACAALAIRRLGARSSMPDFNEVTEYIRQEL